MKTTWFLALIVTTACGAKTGASAMADAANSDDSLLNTDAGDVQAVKADAGCSGAPPMKCCVSFNPTAEMVCSAGQWQCPSGSQPPYSGSSCANPCFELCYDAGPDHGHDAGPDNGLEPDTSDAEDSVTPVDSADAPDIAAPMDVSETSGGGQVGDLCGGSGDPACAASLVCCYPCGMAGCHNKCAVPCSGPGCFGGCPALP